MGSAADAGAMKRRINTENKENPESTETIERMENRK